MYETYAGFNDPLDTRLAASSTLPETDVQARKKLECQLFDWSNIPDWVGCVGSPANRDCLNQNV
jgi:hypothetical protein